MLPMIDFRKIMQAGLSCGTPEHHGTPEHFTGVPAIEMIDASTGAGLRSDGTPEHLEHHKMHVNDNSCNVIPMVRSSTEARLKKVREMLADNPDLFYAVLTEEEDNDMRVAIGIKAKGVVELAIPIHKYDAFKLMQLIEKYGAGK